MTAHHKKTPVARALGLACTSTVITSITGICWAQQAPASSANTQTVTITITAKSGAYGREKESASAVAPTQASLDATQPQSVITRAYIEQSVAPTAEYSRVVNIAPSLSGDSANGPGLSETKTTMRGFSDDQYNITFDGIPWGDTNNPAHHSTSFFPAAVIGGVVVERGPGNASNLGFATFGGSLNLYSKKPGKEQAVSVFGSAGTWNTRLLGAAFESGEIAGLNQATVQANLQHLESDGYLTLNKIKSDNVLAKFEMAVGSSSTLTLLGTVNHIRYAQNDNSKGPTLAQVARFGKNYSLNSDATSFNYDGYNHTTKDTDFEYARLRTDWGQGLNTEAQVYTYAYNNQTISSTDPTGKTAPGTKVGPPGNKNIPGIDKQNKYRVVGGIFRGEQAFGDLGLLRAGAWIDTSDTDRHQYDLDLTLGNIRDPRETKPTPVQNASVPFDQQSKISSVQPYAEFEWQATPSTLVTPGIKAVQIKRSVDAVVNQTTRLPQQASVTYKSTLPFLTVNQQLGGGIAAYAQFAQGFQIPDLKSFYIANPANNSSTPQKSTNYQLGVVGISKDVTWDADLYRIDFKNKYVSNGLAGDAAAFLNIGGATYQGAEAQVTVMVGGGFALYANGSINKATSNTTGQQIAGAPASTAALGALYNAGPWGASLTVKRTGDTHQQEYEVNPATYEQYKVAAIQNVDLSLSHTLRGPVPGVKALKLQLNLFNLLNKQAVTSISPASTAAYDQYLFQAPRSLQVSAKLDF